MLVPVVRVPRKVDESNRQGESDTTKPEFQESKTEDGNDFECEVLEMWTTKTLEKLSVCVMQRETSHAG